MKGDYRIKRNGTGGYHVQQKGLLFWNSFMVYFSGMSTKRIFCTINNAREAIEDDKRNSKCSLLMGKATV